MPAPCEVRTETLERSIDAVGNLTNHIWEVEHIWRATLSASGGVRAGVRLGRSGRSRVDWAGDGQVWGMHDGHSAPFYTGGSLNVTSYLALLSGRWRGDQVIGAVGFNVIDASNVIRTTTCVPLGVRPTVGFRGLDRPNVTVVHNRLRHAVST